ncbi:MAG: sugar transferase [Gemmatimonadota bacterium]
MSWHSSARTIPVARAPLRSTSYVYGAIKRTLDVGLALAGFLVTWPLWILLPIAIKLEDGGPVFFRQRRVGKDGELFTVLKFRSMVVVSGDKRIAQLAEPDRELITKVGRLMRATAMDELPQLLNILRGEMSFVGPRAVPPVERVGDGNAKPIVVASLPGFRLRQSVRPGLTGLAQVYAPRHISHQQKFRFDLLYISRRSLGLDLKLILLSIWISLRSAWPQVGR